MAVKPEQAEVKAAGGVVWRRAGEMIAIAIAHRPRYDDWSLPKGKLDPGESWEQAALREIEEETGLRCELGEELEPARYISKGRPKTVRYWRMSVVEELGHAPDDEVDEMRWLTPAEALTLLVYEHDRDLVRSL